AQLQSPLVRAKEEIMLHDRFRSSVAGPFEHGQNGVSVGQHGLNLNIPTHMGKRYRSPGRGAAATFAGVICSIDFPPTCTKLNSRAASNALTASFTFERATNSPKNVSSSVGSTAITQSRYFETSAESASGTESCTPSLIASGAQRYSRSQTEPSLAL